MGIGAGLLIVLGCLAFSGANAALWINGVTLNSHQWVNTVGPLHSDETVAAAVADAVVGRVLEQSNLTRQRIGGPSLGPARNDALVRRIAVSVSRRLIATEQFGVVWRQANEIAHREALALIGRSSEPNPGSVVLPLNQLASDLDAALIGQGIVLFPDGRPARIADFTVLDNGQRTELRQAAGVIDGSHIILPLLAVVLLVSGFVLARNQLRALTLAGAGVAIACAALHPGGAPRAGDRPPRHRRSHHPAGGQPGRHLPAVHLRVAHHAAHRGGPAGGGGGRGGRSGRPPRPPTPDELDGNDGDDVMGSGEPDAAPPTTRAVSLADLRENYQQTGLRRADLADDPMTQFDRWFDTWLATGPYDGNAVVLATADPSGRPSARYVLLKGVTADGFVFYTDDTSRKGDELAATRSPRCASAGWISNRQVRVEGPVTEVTDAESDAYFATRPRGSQLGAWASEQSRGDWTGRRQLEERPAPRPRTRFAGVDVPRPPHWGGYRLEPDEIEFWQGRPTACTTGFRYTGRRPGWRSTACPRGRSIVAVVRRVELVRRSDVGQTSAATSRRWSRSARSSTWR